MATSHDHMDVTDLIIQQHQQVRSLFRQLSGVTGTAAEETFCELRRLLAVHETAEEEIIYPALALAGEEGKQIADARRKEENKAKRALADAEKAGCDAPNFASLVEHLKLMVIDHADHEERTVLPVLRRTQSAEQRQRMTAAFELAEKAAPTHPHPHGPESAVGNLVLGPAVAIMDKVRDAISSASGKA